MLKEKDTINARQAVLIVILAIFSVIIRVIPKYCSDYAKEGTWITIILGVLPILFLTYILDKIMRRGKTKGLEEAFENILGKVPGKILTALYTVVLILMLSLQIRFFAEKFTASIFHKVPLEFFIITMAVFMQIIARNSIKGFARFAEFVFPLVMIFILAVFILSIGSVKISNLYPVTIYDMPEVLESMYPFMLMVGIITYIPFLGEYIRDRENVKKEGYIGTIFLSLVSLLIVLSTIGTFGYKLTQDLNLPYFIILKNIKILTVIERIESIAITFWTITDIVMIGVLYFIITHLLNKQFKTNHRENYVLPLTLIIFPLSLLISLNFFELQTFIKGPATVLFVGFKVVVPIFIWIIGMIRKKI